MCNFETFSCNRKRAVLNPIVLCSKEFVFIDQGATGFAHILQNAIKNHYFDLKCY